MLTARLVLFKLTGYCYYYESWSQSSKKLNYLFSTISWLNFRPDPAFFGLVKAYVEQVMFVKLLLLLSYFLALLVNYSYFYIVWLTYELFYVEMKELFSLSY